MRSRHPQSITLFLLLPAVCLALLGWLTAPVLALTTSDDRPDSGNLNPALQYNWNVDEHELPLLQLPDQLNDSIDRSLSYPLDQFRLPIFQTVEFRKDHDRYFLPALSSDNNQRFVFEFQLTRGSTYLSVDGANQFVDNDTLKTLRTADGVKYQFVRYADGKFRCASIHTPSGTSLNLLYTVADFTLTGVVDSSGRRVTFNYYQKTLESVTQTWVSDSKGQSRTWTVHNRSIGVGPNTLALEHAAPIISSKSVPENALTQVYTSAMAASDKVLARIFGGPNAVAGGNGFEPVALGPSYPRYRGDVVGADGVLKEGHLSHAIHLYGSADGTGDSPLYVPAGFKWYSGAPSSSDAAVLFYYPRLGNLSDITVAIFHVADFQLVYEGDRFRIGNIGGPGGASATYKHSHIEFYRGRQDLPSGAARLSLRIRPTTVFGLTVASASSASTQ